MSNDDDKNPFGSEPSSTDPFGRPTTGGEAFGTPAPTNPSDPSTGPPSSGDAWSTAPGGPPPSTSDPWRTAPAPPPSGQYAAPPASGRKAERLVDASGRTLGGRGEATAGKVMGMIGTGLMVIGIIVLIAVIAVGGSSIDSNTGTTTTFDF